MIRPVVAIVGRPNVGKSTLFNRLVGRRRSLVHDVPGVTRDRLYGTVAFERWQATVVDTGGFEPGATSDIMAAVREQIMVAIDEADVIVLVVDARQGLTPLETEIAATLRRSQRPVVVAANKIDGAGQEAALGECYRLGFQRVLPVSAEHGRGVAELLEAVREVAPAPVTTPEGGGPRVAIVGRPNVGKSLLVNTLLGEDRVIVDEVPGTTRDAVDTVLRYHGEKVVLIDTAGIRRPGRVEQGVEKHSLARTKQAIERCDIAVVLVDAVEGITAQDIHILGLVNKAYKGAILGINKIDLVADVGAPAGASSFSPVGSDPAPRPRKSRDAHPHPFPPPVEGGGYWLVVVENLFPLCRVIALADEPLVEQGLQVLQFLFRFL